MDNSELFDMAVSAAAGAYCKYSGFHVGAALLAADGRVFTGCNIENISYSLTVCAERTAVFRAVAEGCTDFAAIAIAGSSTDDFSKPCIPCGACLQVLSEFCKKDMRVILADGEYTLEDFLPKNFTM